jgi:hypothetical protein
VGSSWLSLGWDPAVTRCSGGTCSLDVHCPDFRTWEAPAPDLAERPLPSVSGCSTSS